MLCIVMLCYVVKYGDTFLLRCDRLTSRIVLAQRLYLLCSSVLPLILLFRLSRPELLDLSTFVRRIEYDSDCSTSSAKELRACISAVAGVVAAAIAFSFSIAAFRIADATVHRSSTCLSSSLDANSANDADSTTFVPVAWRSKFKFDRAVIIQFLSFLSPIIDGGLEFMFMEFELVTAVSTVCDACNSVSSLASVITAVSDVSRLPRLETK